MAGRGLDHLVLGVHDLDAAGTFYERLGFRVGARNRHPWGTHNRIVQFPGTFLEIITVGEPELIPEHMPGRFSFGAFVRDALTRGEGFSMLVLESPDAAADNAAFQAAGIGTFEPFFFERQAKRPDGSTVRVAFSLAFATDPLSPDCGFFVCQQHEPQNFWNPGFQDHPNTARQISAVTMMSDAPHEHCRFLEAFTGNAQPTIHAHGVSFALPRGRIDVVMSASAPAALRHFQPRPAFAGFSVQLDDMAALKRRLDDEGIAHAQSDSTIFVSAFGVMIAFEAA